MYKNESDKVKVEYIFNEYRRLMLSKAFTILKDRELAEKALYDSFIQVWKNIGSIDDPRNSRSIVLVITIVKNCAYALAENKGKDLEPVKDNQGFNSRGLEDALYDMSASDIIKVINKLGGKNKNVFLLKYAYDFTNKKTADTLKETKNNVAARLQKAQKKLRALLLRGGF